MAIRLDDNQRFSMNHDTAPLGYGPSADRSSWTGMRVFLSQIFNNFDSIRLE
jgi:hypothetical protein